MSKKIILKKATRVEGNANIHIEIADGRVETARFMVQDFRGFEKFVQGRRIEFVPHLISRICGLCSSSHQVASLRGIEDGLDITPTQSTEALRDVIALGELIGSHALSYYYLSMPDQVGAPGGVFDLIKTHPDVMQEAIALRKEGQEIVKLIGKRAVHPVSMGVGRFLVPPTKDEIKQAKHLAEKIMKRAFELILKAEKIALTSKRIFFPENQQVNFVAFDGSSGPKKFHVYDIHGNKQQGFSIADFENNVSEMRADWSFAKFPYLAEYGFPSGIMLVGPLSRSFIKDGFLDDPELKNTALANKVDRTAPCLESYDTCRLLEIFWSGKKIIHLLDSVDIEDLDTPVDIKLSGQGIGVVEAPRGILVHSYLINRGCIERMRLLVATQFNNPFINLLIRDIAEKHVQKDKISTEGDKLIGRCIRIFDPCLSCATH